MFKIINEYKIQINARSKGIYRDWINNQSEFSKQVFLILSSKDKLEAFGNKVRNEIDFICVNPEISKIPDISFDLKKEIRNLISNINLKD